LLSLGAITLATIPRYGRGIEMLVAHVHEIVGLGLVGYGVVLLSLARWLHARAESATLELVVVPVASKPADLEPVQCAVEPQFMPAMRRATTAGRAITVM
jgi:hypothetical protein